MHLNDASLVGRNICSFIRYVIKKVRRIAIFASKQMPIAKMQEQVENLQAELVRWKRKYEELQKRENQLKLSFHDDRKKLLQKLESLQRENHQLRSGYDVEETCKPGAMKAYTMMAEHMDVQYNMIKEFRDQYLPNDMDSQYEMISSQAEDLQENYVVSLPTSSPTRPDTSSKTTFEPLQSIRRVTSTIGHHFGILRNRTKNAQSKPPPLPKRPLSANASLHQAQPQSSTTFRATPPRDDVELSCPSSNSNYSSRMSNPSSFQFSNDEMPSASSSDDISETGL